MFIDGMHSCLHAYSLDQAREPTTISVDRLSFCFFFPVGSFFLLSIQNTITKRSAFECYRYEPRSPVDGRSLITCPLVCLGGDKDGGAPRSDLEHWASFTTGEFRLRTFEGGHFFLQGDGEPAVLEFLSDVLAPLLR